MNSILQKSSTIVTKALGSVGVEGGHLVILHCKTLPSWRVFSEGKHWKGFQGKVYIWKVNSYPIVFILRHVTHGRSRLLPTLSTVWILLGCTCKAVFVHLVQFGRIEESLKMSFILDLALPTDLNPLLLKYADLIRVCNTEIRNCSRTFQTSGNKLFDSNWPWSTFSHATLCWWKTENSYLWGGGEERVGELSVPIHFFLLS